MLPLWISEQNYGSWDPTPCKCCGHIGKHLAIHHQCCAEMERESATAARVVTDRAWARIERMAHEADVYFEKAEREMKAADELVRSMQQALDAAKKSRVRVYADYAERKKLRDMAHRQKMAMLDVVNAAEVREELAKEAVEDVESGDHHGEDDRYECDAGVAEDPSNWWEQGEGADPEELEDDEEARYLNFMAGWKYRVEERRKKEARRRREPMRIAEEASYRGSRAERWVATLQTPTPAVSIKQEESESDDASTVDGTLLALHRDTAADAASTRREMMQAAIQGLAGDDAERARSLLLNIFPDMADAAEQSEQAESAASSSSTPVTETAVAATGRPRRTTRRSRRSQPY